MPVLAPCVAVLAAALAVFVPLRRRLRKNREVALLALACSAPFALGALILAFSGELLGAAPLLTVVALLAAAAGALVPTARSRFREFERAFWSYVEMYQLERTRG
jgi:CHASE2 domain-containing sensor protein